MICSLACLITFAGCKSSPEANTVDSLLLLDNKSSFFIAIPKNADRELVNRIIKNNVDGISDKDCKTVVDRIDKIYCGLNRTKRSTEIQASLSVNIPTAYVSKVFTKKGGWQKSKYKTPYSVEHDLYSSSEIDVSVPSSSNLCIGRDVESMLDKFDDVKINGNLQSDLDETVYNFLRSAESEIHFYANKPQSFLTILTGTNLNLQLNEVSGTFKVDENHDNQYIVTLNFVFKSEKFAKAGRGLLNLAFGLSAEESESDKNELVISGIKISKESLYKLLVI